MPAILLDSITLDGRNDDDILIGGAGDDILTGGGGSDLLNGGDGIDTLFEVRDADFVLQNATDDPDTANITEDAKLDVTPANGSGLVETDWLESVELAELVGGASPNVINASTFTGNGHLQAGVDGVILVGAGGDDELSGGAGDDFLSGGEGVDIIDGGAGTDTLVEEADSRFVLVGDTNNATLDMAEGANEMVTVSVANATGGSFTLTFGGEETRSIAFDASAGAQRRASGIERYR